MALLFDGYDPNESVLTDPMPGASFFERDAYENDEPTYRDIHVDKWSLFLRHPFSYLDWHDSSLALGSSPRAPIMNAVHIVVQYRRPGEPTSTDDWEGIKLTTDRPSWCQSAEMIASVRNALRGQRVGYAVQVTLQEERRRTSPFDMMEDFHGGQKGVVKATASVTTFMPPILGPVEQVTDP